jgi:hypothetical protein
MLSRGQFIIAGAGAALCMGATGDVRIPTELRGGRFFAIPRLHDGSTLACWLDTDSDGFIFSDTVARLKLATHNDAGGATYATPPVLGAGPLLVVERSATDPIMQGFGAQLGAPWFAGHVWEFDYRYGTLTRLNHGLTASKNTVEVGVSNNIPRVLVTIDDTSYNTSFDTAATIVSQSGMPIATSFVPTRTLDSWHRNNTDWTAGTLSDGYNVIVVPQVRLGPITLRNVAFSTRPNDDVFQGDDVDLKLGPNAFFGRVATLDYAGKLLAVT